MKALITAVDLGERIGVRASTIRSWARKGVIPVVRISHKVIRFDYEVVLEALQAANQQTEDTE